MKEFFTNFRSFLSVLVLVGSGWMFYVANDADTKMVLGTWIGMVLAFYFQTTKGSQDKDATIANATKALGEKNVSGQ